MRSALLTRIPITGFSWSDIESERSRRNIEALRAAGSTDLDAFVREFDAENTALRHQNSALEKELAKLRTDVQNLNAVAVLGVKEAKKPVAVQDYFPGESAQFLKEAISQTLNGHVLEGSRRAIVLQEFYERMEGTPELDERRKKLKDILSSSDDLDAKAFKTLQELGFSITSEGKHHKLTYFGDQRLIFTMAKTSSDWRAGKNLASDIARKVF